jgi:dihydropteroate synthase
MGFRLLIGASRKRFLKAVSDGEAATDRDDATAAVTTVCALAGAWAVRVHAVPASRAATMVVEHLSLPTRSV